MTGEEKGFNVYLIVVEGLVDDTCYGFTFICNTDKHSHVIQEALEGRCSTALDGTSSHILFHLTHQQLSLMLASDACSCSEEHARQAGGKGELPHFPDYRAHRHKFTYNLGNIHM